MIMMGAVDLRTIQGMERARVHGTCWARLVAEVTQASRSSSRDAERNCWSWLVHPMPNGVPPQ